MFLILLSMLIFLVLEIGVPKNNKQSALIQKPSPNMIGGIQIVDSKDTNMLKEKNIKIEEQLKTLKDEDLEDLPDLE